MKKRSLIPLLLLIISSCSPSGKSGGDDPDDPTPTGGTDFNPTVVEKTISKEEYVNKTLGGLLGQFAGFLSGYEFARWSGSDMAGLPEGWFDFINGPCAGNFTYFTPGDPQRYVRLRNDSNGRSSIWSDDDYHVDIFNQYVMKEAGYTSTAIKDVWKKYSVGDWGGGQDAMMLINSKSVLSPFTGSIEAGNRYGWCTEAYIENETLGMNAAGMPNQATKLVDIFGGNVGYFNSLNWGKFYAAMYSLAYFETDVRVIMEKAKEVLPENSYPYKIYNLAHQMYNTYPDNYKTAAKQLSNYRRYLYRLDNVQTDPDINGGFAILAWLYGQNDYMKTAKYSSVMGFDGDCTAAICCGLMGVLKGFKPANEEYAKINEKLYHNGLGVYVNDRSTDYQARILSELYPTEQKIDDIVKMYQDNFETILLANGGRIDGTKYVVPTTDLIKSHCVLFDNYDAENRNTTGFDSKNGTLTSVVKSDDESSHSGNYYFNFTNKSNGEVSHKYKLIRGKTYRLTTYAKTNAQTNIFARSGNGIIEEITFANVTSLIAKTFVFTADANNIDVGFRFDGGKSTDYVIFDDFMLEEINTPTIAKVGTQDLTLYTGKYTKIISKPNDVELGKEVLLTVEYRSYGGSPLISTVVRNGNTSNVYGGFVFSNTSANSLSGRGVVEIPYIFESISDAIQLVFPNTSTKIYIGSIEIRQAGQYMFR